MVGPPLAMPCLQQDLRAEDATLAFGGGGGGEWIGKGKLAKRVWLRFSGHPHVLSDQECQLDNHSKALLQLSSLCWTPCCHCSSYVTAE